MFDEDDLLPISALQHLIFCPRQCADPPGAGVEREPVDRTGAATSRPRHDAPTESRGDLRIVRGLRLASGELGLSGQADVVELRCAGPDTPADQHFSVPGLEGQWSVYPVEYKRGKAKSIDCDRVQLCAQALCLEEMLHVQIPEGSLFYGQPRRREHVQFDESMRQETREAAAQLHQLIRSGVTPPPEPSAKCKSCSMLQTCRPKEANRGGRVQAYLNRQLAQSLTADLPQEPDREDA